MTMAGLVESPRRGVFVVTQRGKELLASKPMRVDMKVLRKYPDYQPARRGDAPAEEAAATAGTEDVEVTPEEAMSQAYASLRAGLAQQLLETTMQCKPAFFEDLIVKLMIKMGYGGSRDEAGRAVGRPEIQQFVGALAGQRAK